MHSTTVKLIEITICIRFDCDTTTIRLRRKIVHFLLASNWKQARAIHCNWFGRIVVVLQSNRNCNHSITGSWQRQQQQRWTTTTRVNRLNLCTTAALLLVINIKTSSWYLPNSTDVVSVSMMILKQCTKSCDAARMYSASTGCEPFFSWSKPVTDRASDDSRSFAWWRLYVVILVKVTSWASASCFTEITNQITSTDKTLLFKIK